MYRVLVTGDRKWDDPLPISMLLGWVYNHCKQINRKMLLIEGGARGADKLAAEWAKGYTHDSIFKHVQMPADWETHHKAAGPIRNRMMLKKLLKGPEDSHRIVFAFHNDLSRSKGTRDMVNIARKYGVPVYVMGSLDA